jgi:hypothetical protein
MSPIYERLNYMEEELFNEEEAKYQKEKDRKTNLAAKGWLSERGSNFNKKEESDNEEIEQALFDELDISDIRF